MIYAVLGIAYLLGLCTLLFGLYGNSASLIAIGIVCIVIGIIISIWNVVSVRQEKRRQADPKLQAERELAKKNASAIKNLSDRINQTYNAKIKSIDPDNNGYPIIQAGLPDRNLIANRNGIYVVLTYQEYEKKYNNELANVLANAKDSSAGNEVDVEAQIASMNFYQRLAKDSPIIQRIPFDKIQCFMKIGDVQYTSKISGGGGGGSSLSGAIIGALIAGETGAIIGSRKSTQQIKTTVEAHDTRKTQLRYLNKNGAIEIFEREGYDLYDYLLSKIPEKDLLSIQLEQDNRSKKRNESPSRADRLRELKSLLDDGILTEEEFNSEKKKILSES